MTSAADARALPQDGLPEVALVGRSNVGKSSLINALVRARVARTSAAPGKTRIANVYRVARESAETFYLVDLPGYGFARGGHQAARDFEALTRMYFGQERLRPRRAEDMQIRGEASASVRAGAGSPTRQPRWGAGGGAPAPVEKSVLFLVDARHPGLENDRAAWTWLKKTVAARAIVATKIDKLARGQRIRAMRELESVFDDSVLPVSAVTGEGLDDLWKLIDRLNRSSNSSLARNRNSRPDPPHPRRRS